MPWIAKEQQSFAAERPRGFGVPFLYAWHRKKNTIKEEDMAKVLEEVLNKTFSRRDFLKGSVAATAAVAGLGFAGKESTLASAESVAPSEGAAVADAAEGGK